MHVDLNDSFRSKVFHFDLYVKCLIRFVRQILTNCGEISSVMTSFVFIQEHILIELANETFYDRHVSRYSAVKQKGKRNVFYW